MMTKKEFQAKVANMLAVSKRNLEYLDNDLRPALEPVLDGLREHDPELARLVEAADLSAIAPLKDQVRYLAAWSEN